ncbi:hypothetical protein [Pedobacter cryoconitis]|uniref:hypothetical protein n=1 Tax=Pedobacter cryoconitis TaxID=188932 RepID=UPI0016087EEF|nr:hypothetical protein [Pedobacter cryoconitis]MBB5644836.1 tetratricopeptide (TPR) repeat protein [Pedobacter cryoconitis]
MKKILIGILCAVFLVAVVKICYNMFDSKNDSTNPLALQDELESGKSDYNLGTEAMNKNQFQEGEKRFLEVLKRKDKLEKDVYLNTLVNLGICYVRQAKYDQAKIYWTQAANLGDRDAIDNLKKLEIRK